LSDADECKWYDGKTFSGVGGSFCQYGKVIQLVMVEANGVTMTSNNLDGTIPNEIALLSNSLGSKLLAFIIKNLIFILDFASFNTEQTVIFYNRLTGLIPSEIGLMKSLSELHHSF
jgi:hypothetical protein